MSYGFVPCVSLAPSDPAEAPYARRNAQAFRAVAPRERTDSRFVQQSSELRSRSSDATRRGKIFYLAKRVPERRIDFARAAFHFEVSSGGLFSGWGLDANEEEGSGRKRDTYSDNADSFDPDSFGNERNGFDSAVEDVVQPPPSGGVVLEIMEPLSFDQATAVKAIQALKDRKLVILNLGTMPIDQAQQMHNFISGGCYALGGQQRYLAENIFFFGPAWVHINEWTARGLADAASQTPGQAQTHTYAPPSTSGTSMGEISAPSIFSRSLTSDDDL